MRVIEVTLKTIIAGSRDITELWIVEKAIQESGFVITEVVCGGARGVDSLGRDWANGRRTFAGKGNIVPVKMFLADWDRFGKSAGFKRNAQMAFYAAALIAVWDGESRGTMHMINLARKQKLRTYIVNERGKKRSA